MFVAKSTAIKYHKKKQSHQNSFPFSAYPWLARLRKYFSFVRFVRFCKIAACLKKDSPKSETSVAHCNSFAKKKISMSRDCQTSMRQNQMLYMISSNSLSHICFAKQRCYWGDKMNDSVVRFSWQGSAQDNRITSQHPSTGPPDKKEKLLWDICLSHLKQLIRENVQTATVLFRNWYQGLLESGRGSQFLANRRLGIVDGEIKCIRTGLTGSRKRWSCE